jgi:hypothetical protein
MFLICCADGCAKSPWRSFQSAIDGSSTLRCVKRGKTPSYLLDEPL